MRDEAEIRLRLGATVHPASGAGQAVRVLFDVLGRAVLRARLVAGKAVLDTSRLPPGVYVVQVGSLTQHVTLVK